MRGLRIIGAGWLLASAVVLAPAGQAANAEIRLARQYGLARLPLMIVEHERLIQKHAEAAGLTDVAVDWVAPEDGTSAIEQVLSGKVDIVAPDLTGLATMWDRSWGTAHEMRGLGALASTPYVLVSRNPAVKTIRDFTPKDRIAVPALKLTGPAVTLEMAAAQEWGQEHYDWLASITVARPPAEATTALLAGNAGIDAHFADAPWYDYELAQPQIHRVMDSFDIAGTHSSALLAAPKSFHDANPKLCAALLSALIEADTFIRNNPGEAAEIYVAMADDAQSSVEDLTDLLADPDATYTTTPAGVMRLTTFMQRIGRIKHRPESWKDLFFPEAHTLPGS
ncbi:MAG: ABC transporter substrate-binding protein [Alphaproteobacteria bacterium]|nr:ABC transporter substrate-binding protein [Alphaproteobacteria bacterium]MBV9863124.1 ABC transporter substrate-binding protein [Alphaproteobacteria bacterium]